MEEKFFNNTKYAAGIGILGLIAVCFFLSIYLIVSSIFKFQSIDQLSYDQITVQGYGEVVAVPDVATFSFTVEEMADTSEEAQNLSAEKANTAIDYLKSQGIADEDIKTTNFNVYPRYEYKQRVCITIPCEPGGSELVGYQVSNTVSVKVRESERAGEFVSKITEMGINNISNLQFVIDDEETLSDEARKLAIEDAKKRAEEIARDLGVKLVKVSSFSEDIGRPEKSYAYGAGDMQESRVANIAPDLQSGSSTVTSVIYVSYKIK